MFCIIIKIILSNILLVIICTQKTFHKNHCNEGIMIPSEALNYKIYALNELFKVILNNLRQVVLKTITTSKNSFFFLIYLLEHQSNLYAYSYLKSSVNHFF